MRSVIAYETASSGESAATSRKNAAEPTASTEQDGGEADQALLRPGQASRGAAETACPGPSPAVARAGAAGAAAASASVGIRVDVDSG